MSDTVDNLLSNGHQTSRPHINGLIIWIQIYEYISTALYGKLCHIISCPYLHRD